MTSYFSIFQQQPRAYSVTQESEKESIISFLSEIPPDAVVHGGSALSFEISHQLSLAGVKVLHIEQETHEVFPYFTKDPVLFSLALTPVARSSGSFAPIPSENFIALILMNELRREFGYLVVENALRGDLRQASINEGAFHFVEDEIIAAIQGHGELHVKIKSKEKLFEIPCKYFLNFTEKRFELRKSNTHLLSKQGVVFTHAVPLPCIEILDEGVKIFPLSIEKSLYCMESGIANTKEALHRVLPQGVVVEIKNFVQPSSYAEHDGRIYNFSGNLLSSSSLTEALLTRFSEEIEINGNKKYQKRILPSAFGKPQFASQFLEARPY